MCDSKANQGEMQEPHHSLIVRVVSSVLDKLISGHVESPKHTLGCGNEFMKFQSSYAPDVSIESYLERVRRYSRCSDACFVMALIYVDRLIESKNLVLTTLNAHRLLITSVMLAAKFHDDLFYNNAYYSKLGGLSLNELNHLEAELLHLLDFSLFVKEVAYCKYSMQLQNYVFYLEVVPAPRSAGAPGPMLANINMPHLANMSQGFVDSAQAQAQAAAMSAYFAPQVAQSLRQAALGNMGFQYPSQTQDQSQSHGQGQYASSALCVPSPDNPHAKACSFSEHYLSTNSPLRIAPCAVASANAAAANAANANARQALLQAQAQVLSQRYSQNYFRDASECSSASAAGNGSGMGGYFNNYTPAYSTSASAAPMVCSARDPMRDSIDETSTTCSTRTASPYPALYSRSSSSNMLLAGTSSSIGGNGVSASGSGMHSAVLTPSMYPAQGVLNMHQVHSLPAHAHAQQQQVHSGVSGVGVSASGVWGGESYHSPMQCAMQQQSAMHGHGVYSTHTQSSMGGNTHSLHPHHTQAHHQQGGYQRTDLSIQTDLQDAYPMQRSDSNISAASATTPYSAYHPAHTQQQQQVQQQQGQYRLSPVNRSMYPANSTYTSHSNSASHANTPNHYYQSQLTPTERRYQPNYFASSDVYNYRNNGSCGGNECEASVSTPRDYYSHDYTNSSNCANNTSAYPRHFPCPSAMLYASNTSMGMHNPNVNVNMHGAMSDPMNFYGYSAGVNAGQM